MDPRIRQTQTARAQKTPSGAAPAGENRRGTRPATPPVKGQNVPPVRRSASPRRPEETALTPEQKRLRRERWEREQREKERRLREREERKLRRREWRLFLLKISLVLAVVFVGLYWLIVFLTVGKGGTDAEDAFPMKIFIGEEKKEACTLEAENVFFDGTNYLPLSVLRDGALKDHIAFTYFGDEVQPGFSLKDGKDFATFLVGRSDVIINGQKVSLSAAAFFKDEELYIPIDFFTDRMNCFSFSYSAVNACNVLTFDSSAEPAFVIGQAETCTPIPWQEAYEPKKEEPVIPVPEG